MLLFFKLTFLLEPEKLLSSCLQSLLWEKSKTQCSADSVRVKVSFCQCLLDIQKLPQRRYHHVDSIWFAEMNGETKINRWTIREACLLTDGQINQWMDGWTDRQMNNLNMDDEWINGQTDTGWMMTDGWIIGWMDEWMERFFILKSECWWVKSVCVCCSLSVVS